MVVKVRKLIESLKIKGLLQIFNARTGELLYEKYNLVVNTGLALLVDNLKVSTGNLTHIEVGTGATPVLSTDTALETPLLRKAISDIDTIENVLTAETIFTDLEAVGTWKEVGMFTAPSGGVMFNRINIDFVKDTSDPVRVKFTVTISTS